MTVNSKDNNRTTAHILIKSAFLSLIWNFLTIFLGLLQLWITVGISYIVTTQDYTISDALQEGALLFFIMAVIAAITVDYHFVDLPIMTIFKGFMFTLFPLIIGIFVTVLYVTLYLVDEKLIDKEVVSLFQYILIILTVIYAMMAKFIMFFYEEWKNG
jgi:hypothetical protein